MKALIIDADYLLDREGDPVIRLYCKKIGTIDEGKDIIVHAKGFEAYCYANVSWSAKDDVEKALSSLIKRVETVKKFKPIGYQTKKSEMLKVVIKNPKSTPECRRILEEMEIEVMEADIPFKNRFLNDTGMTGMGVIVFNHLGNELKKYSDLNCDELYILSYKEIRVVDEKVNIEY